MKKLWLFLNHYFSTEGAETLKLTKQQNPTFKQLQNDLPWQLNNQKVTVLFLTMSLSKLVLSNSNFKTVLFMKFYPLLKFVTF